VAAAPINTIDFRPSLLIDLVSFAGVPRAHLHAQACQSVLGRPEAIQGLLNGDSRTRRVKTTTHVAWEVGATTRSEVHGPQNKHTHARTRAHMDTNTQILYIHPFFHYSLFYL
jgi:hypothetical protein